MDLYGYEFIRESDLTHHGIKGQKWGIRRFQNEDGSLTAAGEKRYYGKANAIQRDIDSFKGLEKGIYSKSGKMLLSSSDVKKSVSALEAQRDKARAKGDAKRTIDAAKAKKKNIRKEYQKAQRERNKELDAINEKYDKKRTENAFGLDNGSASDRLKKHLKNEYERSQAINKWDQKNLDARRKLRTDLGKKKTDTLLMKWKQESINDISKQTQSEFNRDYIKNLVNQALDTESSYYRDRD